MGSWLTLQISSYLVQRDLFAKTLSIIGQQTMPIMLFHFSAFLIVDLLIEYNILIIRTDIFVLLSKLALGVSIPILLHVVYVYINLIYSHVIKIVK